MMMAGSSSNGYSTIKKTHLKVEQFTQPTKSQVKTHQMGWRLTENVRLYISLIVIFNESIIFV